MCHCDGTQTTCANPIAKRVGPSHRPVCRLDDETPRTFSIENLASLADRNDMVLMTTNENAMGINAEMAASTTDILRYMSIELSEKKRPTVANITTAARRN